MSPGRIALCVLLCSWVVWVVSVPAAAGHCQSVKNLNMSLPEDIQLQHVRVCPRQQGLGMLAAVWRQLKVDVKCSAPSYTVFTSGTVEALASRSSKSISCCDWTSGSEGPCVCSFKLSAMQDWYLAAASSATGSFLPIHTSASESLPGVGQVHPACTIDSTVELNILGDAIRIYLTSLKWCFLTSPMAAVMVYLTLITKKTWPFSAFVGFGMACLVTVVRQLHGTWLAEFRVLSLSRPFLLYLGIAAALRGAVVYRVNNRHGARLLAAGLLMLYLGVSDALLALTAVPGMLLWAACGVMIDTTWFPESTLVLFPEGRWKRPRTQSAPEGGHQG